MRTWRGADFDVATENHDPDLQRCRDVSVDPSLPGGGEAERLPVGRQHGRQRDNGGGETERLRIARTRRKRGARGEQEGGAWPGFVARKDSWARRRLRREAVAPLRGAESLREAAAARLLNFEAMPSPRDRSPQLQAFAGSTRRCAPVATSIAT